MSWNHEVDILMAQVKLKHSPAFKKLYEQTSGKLYGLLIKMLGDKELAADVLQDAYAKIWQNAAQHDSSMGEAWPWLCQVTRNTALDKLRQVKRYPLSLEDVEWVEEIHESNHLWQDSYDMRRCLGKLKREPRQAIIFSYLYGLTHKELSEQLKQPLGTLKSWIRRGMKELEACLGA
ncbi:sigma-70 family RNA polymerase sigma factor [Neptunomonas sp.]|uniref:RNA polymerase sigma factor n=1 Tax=Neptunomonas sp. TaxID=1971898 RepID=UPI0025EB17C4|nr:sigma-70 family RNA polymerase sigma factor [Neptunomonas sp.]